MKAARLRKCIPSLPLLRPWDRGCIGHRLEERVNRLQRRRTISPLAFATTSVLIAWASGPPVVAADASSSPDRLRTTAPATAPADARLIMHDVDHPADFVPAFVDKADWERRAAFLRR